MIERRKVDWDTVLWRAGMSAFLTLVLLFTVWAIRQAEDARAACAAKGGVWLDRGNVCVKREALIP